MLSTNLNFSIRPLIFTVMTTNLVFSFILILSLSSCATYSGGSALYDSLGEMEGIENIVSRLIYEIGNNPEIRQYFEDTDLDRFHEKLSEQICEISGGPCRYSGDGMVEVHNKMNISEAHFNLLVDLLITAMDHYQISHRVQNRLLARLAPMREDIIYR